MEKFNLRNRNLIIIAAVVVVLLISSFLFIRSRQATRPPGTEDVLPEEEIIPTVDSSVVVELEPAGRRGEVTLVIKNAPSGTREIEFELTYDAKSPEGGAVVPQGVIGKCRKQKGDEWTCRQSAQGEAIVLGTCSAGTCVYHEVVSGIKVFLKFTGTYGQRVFEKEYEI